MKLLVGLGNPGTKYEKTRHNIGAEVIQEFAKASLISLHEKRFGSLAWKGEIEGKDLLLILPQTYMNRSGRAVVEAIRFYRISPEGVLVAHDDIDLELGRLKLDYDAGSGGHRGVTSVIEEIGTKGFFRLRLGVGRPLRKEEVEGYVLSPFLTDEEERADGMKKEGVRMVQQWIRGG